MLFVLKRKKEQQQQQRNKKIQDKILIKQYQQLGANILIFVWSTFFQGCVNIFMMSSVGETLRYKT